MRSQRHAKIVATLGPASSNLETITRMVEAGVDLFRFNFSHGDHAFHQRNQAIVRSVEKTLNRPIGILADLQGPKLRVGTFPEGPVMLQTGASFHLHLEQLPGDQSQACLPHPEIFEVLHEGMMLLINDGRIHLRVESFTATSAKTRVVLGGEISDRKGVNVPGVVLPCAALTEKDKKDLACALALGADWIGLSFVQQPEDLHQVRALMDGHTALLAKIEKPSALEQLDAILAACDGVMVARGDLGVELSPEMVPAAQKRIINAARQLNKPVIVATQMLESMISSPIPTRAEASDIAAAIYDGADAVMLSGETAVGAYPCEAIGVMDRILDTTERDSAYFEIMKLLPLAFDMDDGAAMAHAACGVALRRNCTAMVAFTHTGSTAMRLAPLRIQVPILGLTPFVETARKLTMAWGVKSVVTTPVEDFKHMVSKVTRITQQEGMAKTGDHITVIAGVPFGTSGSTNILRIIQVTE